jgi:agmatinase
MKFVKVRSCQGALGKNLGCEEAPDKILKDFKNEILDVKVVNDNIDETNKNIYLTAKRLVDDKVIFIGGDHSISYPLFKAFSEANEKNCGLIIFDAHPDCYDEFNLTHENFLRLLIKDKLIKPQNVIIVGVRTFTKEEHDFLKKNNIKYFSATNLYKNIIETCDIVMGIARNFGKFYLSVDIDVVDPAFAPGTGYLEPLGLHSRELIYFLERIKRLKDLQWVDLVEVNPGKDKEEITVKLAKEIVEVLNR